MTLRAGSVPWLLRHELRLSWRDLGGRRRNLALLIYGGGWLALHALLVPAFHAMKMTDEVVQSGLVFVAAMLWVVLTFMLSQAITRSVDVLFDRGDLDLLLASPLPPRHVFVARGLGVALTSVAAYVLLLTPVAHVGLLFSHPNLLAIYPALAAFGLLAAALGMTLTFTLVHLLGARRARVAAQLLGAFVGAAVFLLTQAGNLVSHERTSRWLTETLRVARESAAIDHWTFLWLPLDAMRGRPVPLLALLLAGAGAFTLVVATLAPRFLAGTRESLAAERSRRPTANAPMRFRIGLVRLVLMKEWKLIVRDPQLIAQTLLQALYMLPLVFVTIGNGSIGTLVAPALVTMAALLVSGLAWLTMAAEEAPDLVAAAPVDSRAVRRLKLAAAVLPVWVLVVPFVVFTALSHLYAAAIFTLCVAGATIAAGVIQLALPSPGSRRDLRQRAKGNLLGSALEMLASFGWGALTWTLLVAPSYAPLAALPALAAPATAWWLGRERRSTLLLA